MNAPIVAFFNNKGGVGKTSLVFHLSWMFSELGLRTLSVDLDPQANLSGAFLREEKLEEVWEKRENGQATTVYGCLRPLASGAGDIASAKLQPIIPDRLFLLVGDMHLSAFEDELSEQWPKCLDRKERAFRVISSFWRIMQTSAEHEVADVVLMDLGPNLGAINRAALVSSDYVVIPLSPDLYSLQGLHNLGPTFRKWREEWKERLEKNPRIDDLPIPDGKMEPVGYIVQQHSVRLDRPVKAYEKWIGQIPGSYREKVLAQTAKKTMEAARDPYCLALLKHYRSLFPLGQEARKPIFKLQTTDGAIGAHEQAVARAYDDFKDLAEKIAAKIKLDLP